MTELLEEAVAALRQLPAADQDAIARTLLRFTDRPGASEEIEPEHRNAVLDGMGQADRGEFATDAEVAEAFRRFD